jgi:hypothetical protein
MKPIFQTQFGEGSGNCFPACLASLLEVPLDTFPFPPYQDDWLMQVDAFLQILGWAYITWDSESNLPWSGKFLCIVSGMSVRGIRHSVVAEHYVDNDNLHYYRWIHDPNPDQEWLTNIDHVGILVPISPSLYKPKINSDLVLKFKYEHETSKL